MRLRSILIFISVIISSICFGKSVPRTERTGALINELLTKLDSTEYYAARRENKINALKADLTGRTDTARYNQYRRIANMYFNYVADSAMTYLEKAEQTAIGCGDEALVTRARIGMAGLLSATGYYTEAFRTLESIQRSSLRDSLLIDYYYTCTTLYRNIYSTPGEPAVFKKQYTEVCNAYRDSILMFAPKTSEIYYRTIERKEAKAGNFESARKYNDLRAESIADNMSGANATRLYDRFNIAYNYEQRLTGEALDDLLESAIIEVEDSNQDVASLLKVETILAMMNEYKAAKKVSDYYYTTFQKFGSKKRLIDGISQTVSINDRNFHALQKRKKEIQFALLFISLLLIALVLTLLKINNSRLKITKLKESLQRSGEISRNYVGVVFQLYSSHIKRLEVFRTKIHSSLKKGNVEQALELTTPSGDIASEELKELYHNFDSAFIDIFPDYIRTVNSCLKPESRITPKKSEILTTELRILALIKLGIEDSTKISELLHCSVKTVYNLRSGIKSRLAITPEEFKAVISEL